ncbi:MAG: hypothetical protein HY067_22730 [Betaproteobacteria bacterium]|nr:hypothetical protein [Betaproteobacteria bacterium]
MRYKEIWFYVIAFLAGALVWIVVSKVSGRQEAWDSSLYFSVGYPVLCLLSLAMGYFAPAQSWRWGIVPFAGQFAWLLLSQGPGNLLPLGIIAFAMVSVPAIVAAKVGAYFGSKGTLKGEP